MNWHKHNQDISDNFFSSAYILLRREM